MGGNTAMEDYCQTADRQKKEDAKIKNRVHTNQIAHMCYKKYQKKIKTFLTSTKSNKY